MNHVLMIRPEAEEDLAEAQDWYESQREGLGSEFFDAVELVFNRIRETPELYAEGYRGVRRA